MAVPTVFGFTYCKKSAFLTSKSNFANENGVLLMSCFQFFRKPANCQLTNRCIIYIAAGLVTLLLIRHKDKLTFCSFKLLLLINMFFIFICSRPTALHDRTKDSDEDDLHDKDYDVAVLANNLSQALRYKIYGNDGVEEVISSAK